MSLFTFGDLEVEIDFTDVDFLENLEEAKRLMQEEAKQVPKTGKTAEKGRTKLCFPERSALTCVSMLQMHCLHSRMMKP